MWTKPGELWGWLSSCGMSQQKRGDSPRWCGRWPAFRGCCLAFRGQSLAFRGRNKVGCGSETFESGTKLAAGGANLMGRGYMTPLRGPPQTRCGVCYAKRGHNPPAWGLSLSWGEDGRSASGRKVRRRGGDRSRGGRWLTECGGMFSLRGVSVTYCGCTPSAVPILLAGSPTHV